MEIGFGVGVVMEGAHRAVFIAVDSTSLRDHHAIMNSKVKALTSLCSLVRPRLLHASRLCFSLSSPRSFFASHSLVSVNRRPGMDDTWW